MMYWIEFSDQSGESLGVAIVEAADDANDLAVVEKAIELGCAPARASMCVRRIRVDADIPDSFKGRLLSQAEADALERRGS